MISRGAAATSGAAGDGAVPTARRPTGRRLPTGTAGRGRSPSVLRRAELEPRRRYCRRQSRCLVCRVVLGDDGRRDPAALIHLVPVRPGPLTDPRTLLAPGAVALAPAPGLNAAGSARVVHILGKLGPQPVRVARAEIDLIGDAVKPKAHGLSCLTTVDVVDQ